MTQTSLSAATKPKRGNPCPAARLKWHRPACRGRHSCLPRGAPQPSKGLCTVAKPSTGPIEAAASLPSAFLQRCHKFLIANLELESNLSPIRINDLEFSNRKFSAIFHFRSPTLKRPSPRPVIPPALTQEGKASGQDARAEGSQLSPYSTLPPPAQVKLLIETPRLEIRVTPTKQNQSQFLIETNRALSAFTSHPPPIRPPSDPFRLYARVKNPK
jgi:hypothetical protein